MKFNKLIIATLIGGTLVMPNHILHASNSGTLKMFVGTYNDPEEPGLMLYDVTLDSIQIQPKATLKIDNPSFLTFNPLDSNQLFVISELSENNSTISRVEYLPDSDELEIIDASSVGGSPCYVASDGRNVLTANYRGGSISCFRIDQITSSNNFQTVRKDRLSANLKNYYGALGGTDSVRQAMPHVHCVQFSRDAKRVYATDFSADRILYFVTDSETDSLSSSSCGISGEFIVKDGKQTPKSISLPDQTGPRLLIFDKSGSHAYLIGELSGMVTVFDVDNAGELTIKQTVEADSAHRRGSSHIELSPDGRFLYVSNRLGSDGIVIFSVNDIDGTLTLVGEQPTGRHPRHFAFTPDGAYVFVACRDDNTIEVYKRDAKTGILSDSGIRIPVHKPVCIVFSQG